MNLPTQLKTVLAALMGGSALFVTSMGMVSAQSSEGPKENGYVCMVRSSAGPGGSVQTTKVMAVASKEAFLVGRGFSRTNCGGARKWLRIAGPSICVLKDVNDRVFQRQFFSLHGLSPSEICSLFNDLPSSK